MINRRNLRGRQGKSSSPSPLAGEGGVGGSVGMASASPGSFAPDYPHPGPPQQGGEGGRKKKPLPRSPVAKGGGAGSG